MVSYTLSFVVRFDLDWGLVPWDVVVKTLPLLIAVRMGSLWMFHLYRGLWRYVSIIDLIQIIKAATVGSVVFAVLLVPIFSLAGFPRAVLLLDWVGTVFLLSGIRVFVRVMRERFTTAGESTQGAKRVLIVGAGDAGASLCAEALRSPRLRLDPVAFADDDQVKVGSTIQGVPVARQCREIPSIVTDYRVDSIVIAIPSATPVENRRLVEICQRTKVPFKILPHTSKILDGAASVSRIRDVDPVDLLGRPPARLDREAIEGFIKARRILVTGAAGSVGSELARQLAGLHPELLILVDNAESPLFLLHAEIGASLPDTPLIAFVMDVTDEAGSRRLMMEHKPEVVYHAAAYKHVPLMESTPIEAVRNNIGGTYVMAKNAMSTGVEAFVLVSTDKAVNPTSVMGATKRLAELLVKEMNSQGPTHFVVVRFGNVVASNGSVVPIFKSQIAQGGPITVTHRDATRYFMSLSEAAGLILQASSVGEAGETFVLDMGEPLKIVNVAETLITLSGLKCYEDIDIVFTGLRPGEKLSEELSYEWEGLEHSGHEKLLVVKPGGPEMPVLAEVAQLLRALPDLNAEEVKSRLQGLVPEYRPASSHTDVPG